jgi:hypothetical protein
MPFTITREALLVDVETDLTAYAEHRRRLSWGKVPIRIGRQVYFHHHTHSPAKRSLG